MGLRPSTSKAIRALLWALLLLLSAGVVLQLVGLDDPEETGKGREEGIEKEDGRSAVQAAHAVSALTTRVEVWGKYSLSTVSVCE
jgi:hypothetical protein